MAWTTPYTAVDSSAFSAASANATLRDNFNELAVAKAATVGNHFAVAGTNSVIERQLVDRNDTTYNVVSSGSYTTQDDEGDYIGPKVEGTCSYQAYITISAVASAGSRCAVSFSGGAISASDDRAVFLRGTWTSATGDWYSSATCLVSISGAYSLRPAIRSISGTSTVFNTALTVWEF